MKLSDAIMKLAELQTTIERNRCSAAIDGDTRYHASYRREYKSLLAKVRKALPGFTMDDDE